MNKKHRHGVVDTDCERPTHFIKKVLVGEYISRAEIKRQLRTADAHALAGTNPIKQQVQIIQMLEAEVWMSARFTIVLITTEKGENRFFGVSKRAKEDNSHFLTGLRHAVRRAVSSFCSAIREERLKIRNIPTGFIDIVFDSSPGPVAPGFVEVENEKGASIKVGRWLKRPDGYWVLRITSECSTCDANDILEARGVDLR